MSEMVHVVQSSYKVLMCFMTIIYVYTEYLCVP